MGSCERFSSDIPVNYVFNEENSNFLFLSFRGKFLLDMLSSLWLIDKAWVILCPAKFPDKINEYGK